MRKVQNAGFSLVEIMIAAGILAAISAGVMQVMKNMSQSQVKYNADSEAALITNEIVAILSSPANCLATLGGKNAANTAVGAITGITQGAATKFQAGQRFGDAQVKVNSYALSAAEPDVSIASKTTKLIIRFERKAAQAGTGDVIKKIRMYVDVDGGGNITSCRSLSSSSADIWTRAAGSDIHYSAGNVGVGTVTPGAPLDITATNNGSSSGVRVRMSPGDTTPAYLQFTNNSASTEHAHIRADAMKNLSFSTNAVEALRITSTGDVGVGVFPPTSKLDVNGNVKASIYYGTSFQYTSDRRLKEDIVTLKNAPAILNKLRPVRFNWIKNGQADIGFIAQEVEKQVPEITSQDTSGIKRVDYAKLIPILVGTIQEQQKRIEQLEKKLNEK